MSVAFGPRYSEQVADGITKITRDDGRPATFKVEKPPVAGTFSTLREALAARDARAERLREKSERKQTRMMREENIAGYIRKVYRKDLPVQYVLSVPHLRVREKFDTLEAAQQRYSEANVRHSSENLPYIHRKMQVNKPLWKVTYPGRAGAPGVFESKRAAAQDLRSYLVQHGKDVPPEIEEFLGDEELNDGDIQFVFDDEAALVDARDERVEPLATLMGRMHV